MSRQISKACPRCKHESNADDNYCGNCGVTFIEVQRNVATTNTHTTYATPHLFNRRRILFFSVLLFVIIGVFIFGLNIGKGMASSSNTGIIVTRTPTPSSIPSLPHIYHVGVNSNRGFPGIDTGINLLPGDQLTIKASGQASDGATGPSFCNGEPINPDGVSRVNGNVCTVIFGDSAYPPAPAGTLLARIGQVGTISSTGWFVVSNSFSSTVVLGGKLYLIYNDSKNDDNSGNYQVTITVVQS